MFKNIYFLKKNAFCDQILHQLSVNNRKNCCFCKAKWTRMRTKQFLKECPALLEHPSIFFRFRTGASPSRIKPKAKQPKKTCGVRVLKKNAFCDPFKFWVRSTKPYKWKGSTPAFFSGSGREHVFFWFYYFFEIFSILLLTFFFRKYIFLNVNATSAGK